MITKALIVRLEAKTDQEENVAGEDALDAFYHPFAHLRVAAAA